ncbi:MAG: HTTM domain-containing protein [Bacteroidia bacterium]|nr:HTTM domain-containing protein [Bacteroidia bacterium]
MYKLKKILLYFKQSYAVDLRALSLMRIALALVVIADLIIRAGDLTAHYTDAGVWPTRLIATFNSRPGSWSLHALNGSFAWVAALFALHFLAAAFLLLGYKTRWATLLVWLLTISLQNRNTYILQGGDDLLRLLLFWGLFLPWQAHYSIDSRNKALPRSSFFAGMGYLLLIASVYFFTVNLKWGSDWHNGTAIYYALSLEQIRLPYFGDWLYQWPSVMRLLTYLTYYTELLIPLLILWPDKRGHFRFLAVLLLLALHTGIGLTLYVGLFFVINMVSAIGLIPRFAMNWLETKLRFLKSQSKRLRLKKNQTLHGIKNTLCVTAIVASMILNLSSLSWFAYELTKEIKYPVHFFRMDQFWGMFSPTVLKEDGWYVYYGIDSLGRQHDLYRNKDYVDFKKPQRIVSMYKTDRWRKLAELMQTPGCTFLRPLYGKYILHKWNLEHPDKKMVTLNLYFMEKENLPNYQTEEINKVLFCVCNDN